MPTHNDLTALAAALCYTLKVPAPSVTLRNHENSTYDARLQELTVALHARRGTVASFLHQLAHHVSAVRGWGDAWHDGDFLECLREVVAAYGMPYPWETEKSDNLKAQAGEEI